MEFNWLPLEIQLEIFSYLPVLQVMKIRKVCKQWNGLIKAQFKFKELKCHQIESPKDRRRSDFNFKSFQSFLDYTRSNPMFSRVKYLEAYLYPNCAQLHDAFDLLNSFSSLEQTSFTCCVSGSRRIDWEIIEKKQFVVSLDRLKEAHFYFNSILVLKASVVLNLPRLHYLKVDSLRGFGIKYPERLRTLATEAFFQATWDYSKFTSLTKLYTLTIHRPSITANFLEKLPSLRELHLNNFLNFLDRSGDHSLDPLEPSSSGTAALRIFYAGFEIGFKAMVSIDDQWPELMNSPEGSKFIFRNLHKSVDNNRQVYSLYYNAIVDELDDVEKFEVMPQKFPNMRELHIIGTVADPNRLLKYIGQFQANEFYFESTSLPRWFFEKLAESGSFIEDLEFDTEPTMDILSGDFDFVFQLEKLSYLDFVDWPLPLNFVARLLKEPKPEIDVLFEQPGIYSFQLCMCGNRWVIDLEVNVGGIDIELGYEFPREEAAELANELSGRLKVDGFVNPKELLVLLRQLELEKETHLFMMRKFVYEQRHSIGLSMEQWLNLLR